METFIIAIENNNKIVLFSSKIIGVFYFGNFRTEDNY